MFVWQCYEGYWLPQSYGYLAAEVGVVDRLQTGRYIYHNHRTVVVFDDQYPPQCHDNYNFDFLTDWFHREAIPGAMCHWLCLGRGSPGRHLD